MLLSKISSNGQTTIPLEIRRALQLKTGDKVIFIRNDRGEITLHNLSNSVLTDVQRAVTGGAGK